MAVATRIQHEHAGARRICGPFEFAVLEFQRGGRGSVARGGMRLGGIIEFGIEAPLHVFGIVGGLLLLFGLPKICKREFGGGFVVTQAVMIVDLETRRYQPGVELGGDLKLLQCRPARGR